MMKYSSKKRQRGVGVIELGLALIVLSMVALYGFRLYAQWEDGRRAENQAEVLETIRNSAETLVLEHYTDYQAGLPVTRNGVTLDWGNAAGQALAPTVAQLNDMAVGMQDADEAPYYKSLSEGGYFLRIERIPAGCEASPQGQECNITGLVCFDQPLRDPRRPDETTDSYAIGRMLTKLGANGGAAVDDADGSTIYGFGGAWQLPNPIVDTPPGIICSRFGFGSAGFANFLRVRDTRDPQFQNNVTVGGGVNIQRDQAAGDACTADEEGLIVQGTSAGGRPELLQCRGGTFQLISGVSFADEGTACTVENQFAIDPVTGIALTCSSGTWLSQEGKGIQDMNYYGQGATVPAPACPTGTMPIALIAAVSASNIIGTNNPGNNTGSFQASIDAAWKVHITGSNGSAAGSNAMALVVTGCGW